MTDKPFIRNQSDEKQLYSKSEKHYCMDNCDISTTVNVLQICEFIRPKRESISDISKK